jgi:hypothetical protein
VSQRKSGYAGMIERHYPSGVPESGCGRNNSGSLAMFAAILLNGDRAQTVHRMMGELEVERKHGSLIDVSLSALVDKRISKKIKDADQ